MTKEDSTSERICPECKHLLRFVLGGKCRVLMPDGSRCEHTCSFSEAAAEPVEIREYATADAFLADYNREAAAASEGIPERYWEFDTEGHPPNPKLADCPLCPDGGHPYFTRTVNGTNMIKVGCSQCGIELKAALVMVAPTTEQPTKDILALWNVRVSPSVDEAAVRRAADKIEIEFPSLPNYAAKRIAEIITTELKNSDSGKVGKK